MLHLAGELGALFFDAWNQFVEGRGNGLFGERQVGDVFQNFFNDQVGLPVGPGLLEGKGVEGAGTGYQTSLADSIEVLDGLRQLLEGLAGIAGSQVKASDQEPGFGQPGDITDGPECIAGLEHQRLGLFESIDAKGQRRQC